MGHHRESLLLAASILSTKAPQTQTFFYSAKPAKHPQH